MKTKHRTWDSNPFEMVQESLAVGEQRPLVGRLLNSRLIWGGGSKGDDTMALVTGSCGQTPRLDVTGSRFDS